MGLFSLLDKKVVKKTAELASSLQEGLIIPSKSIDETLREIEKDEEMSESSSADKKSH